MHTLAPPTQTHTLSTHTNIHTSLVKPTGVCDGWGEEQGPINGLQSERSEGAGDWPSVSYL